MTAAGRTALYLDEPLAALLEARLARSTTRIRRRGGMPADWTVDAFLTEVADDGLLRRRGDQLLFLHQSLQEYFTALPFADDAVALAHARARRRHERRRQPVSTTGACPSRGCSAGSSTTRRS